MKYGVYLSSRAQVPATTRMPHPTSIVIGEGVKLGENVTLYQNVTLGGARRGDWKAGNYPEVGEGTTIFAGAVVVGAVKIGRQCVIGANSVVTSDIPDFSTAVGAPARVVRVGTERL
ncbi:serine acetyltransferase [Microbacterium sp. JZ37]|uniref:serine O-acetyltransferase n=1 Tax=Microbacterium sp. JZ37 TaxID=2654193 RepID=UPI002B498290|nr:serine acetyltransferase [Microbacterium sp. JZ37]